MDFNQLVARLLAHRSVRHTYLAVPPEHVDSAGAELPFVANQSYLQVRLHEMYLAHDRELYKTKYPTVYAFNRFLGQNSYTEIVTFAGPRQLRDLSADLRRVMARGHHLLGPIPFRGDEVEILYGLLSIQGDDLAERLLNLLGTVSSVLGAGATSALALAVPIKDAIDDLLNLSQATLRVAVHDRLVSNQHDRNISTLQAGFRVVAAVQMGSIKPEHLWVRDGHLMIGRDPNALRAPNDFDYFLFSLEHLKRRQDWSTLEPLSSRIRSLDDLLASRELSESRIREEFELFKSGVLSCSDLIHTDRVAIVRGIRARIQEALELRSEGLDEGGFLGQEMDLGPRLPMLGDLRQVGQEISEAELATFSVNDLLRMTI